MARDDDTNSNMATLDQAIQEATALKGTAHQHQDAPAFVQRYITLINRTSRNLRGYKPAELDELLGNERTYGYIVTAAKDLRSALFADELPRLVDALTAERKRVEEDDYDILDSFH
jgi:hypothetical protein